MKVVPKYPYQKLVRETINGKRLYTTPNKNKVPSVTTILSATQPIKKQLILEEWRNNIGHQTAKDITEQAASRGTRMHSYLEAFIKNGELPPKASNPLAWASRLMAQVMIDKGLSHVTEIWGMEVSLWIDKLYAGSTDCVGIHINDECIVDFKQSNKPKTEEQVEDYKIQLCAYGLAHNELYDTNIQKGVVMVVTKPATDIHGGILWNDQGEPLSPPTYKEYIIEGEEYELYADKWWKRVKEYYAKV